MIYAVSVVWYALIFILGMAFIKKMPDRAERWVGILVFIGFCTQILINYVGLGHLGVFELLAHLDHDRSAFNLMVLCLISIFCYSALFVMLIKAYDYYQE
ncbi:Uncharacterised protein [Moraxella caprae]|uniref:Uncharacterized protein n=1 Tax=Moraxella caprae TaxID=90240 RepID=A0A378R301_9GAMM|nr:hypothetical protein [Moraxella caprae]STZ09149.1 Uncharacterised protein [Moraxella caprae]